MSKFAKATVTITCEIHVAATWGDECTIAQVYAQAETEALNAINNALRTRVTIIGTPKLQAIVAER